MDLSCDTKTKFNENLNELIKDTYDRAYQDEVKMYTEILAYQVNQQQAGTSNTHRSTRYTDTVPKLIKTSHRNNRSINTHYILNNEDTEDFSDEFEEPLNKKAKNRRSQSIHNIEYYEKTGSQNIETCSKSTDQSFSNMKQDLDDNTSDNKPKYVEKMTYCRPVLTRYNQEFIKQSIERNNRLKRLVRQLVEAREREKDHEAWNNYINDLRNKFKYQSEVDKLHHNIPEDTKPEIIDYYNSKCTCNRSNPCQSLLKDFYSATYEKNYVNDCNYPYIRSYDLTNYKNYNFDNECHCYPTASQGSFMLTKNQRRLPRYHGNTIIVEKDCDQCLSRSQKKIRIIHDKPPLINIPANVAIQTDADLFDNIIKPCEEKGTFKGKYNTIQSNVERLKQKIKKNVLKKTLLSNIENKLDGLLESVNTFLSEIKKKRTSTVDRPASSSSRHSLADQRMSKIEEKVSSSFNGSLANLRTCTVDRSVGSSFHPIVTVDRSAGNSQQHSFTERCISTIDRSSSCSSNRSDQKTAAEKHRRSYNKDFVCGVVQEKRLHCHGCLTKDSIDKILYEEMNKSDKVKRDIEKLLHNPQNPCAIKIMFDIPTKERSTEVTDSMCPTVQNSRFTVEEVRNPDSARMTIAVNTEPLGILALIRVSTETVKQLLSYMPQIDYYSYLSRLQFNQVAQQPRLHNFECNICGATFERPSLLSEHIIQQHNSATTRDCCVCRHVLNMKEQERLFKCHHCGQMFTRAYCRELHEIECARKLGKQHEISSSLMILS